MSVMNRTARVVSLGLALLFPASSAMAVGAGMYFSYGHGWGNVDDDDWDQIFDDGLPYDYDFDENVFGVGFTFDTNVAKNRLFNYRLEIGYERVWQEWPSGNPTLRWDYDFPGNPPPPAAFTRSKYTGNGLSINNAFGFGVVRTDRMRLWVGPALRLNADWYDADDFDVLEFNVGVGPQVGINYHVGERTSLALSFGYQYLFALHSWSREPDYLFPGDEDFDSIGGQHNIFVNLSFFFRSAGDRFVPRKARKAKR